MKKLDPRSIIIGFLLAVISFMSVGANAGSSEKEFKKIIVEEIEVVNSSGIPMVEIGSDRFGGAARILNRFGLNAISLHHVWDGESDASINPTIELTSNKKKIAIALTVDEKIGGELLLVPATGYNIRTISP